MRGTLAQLVEQRTENPCVPGSIPGGTTLKPDLLIGFFVLFKDKKGLISSNIIRLEFFF